MNTTVTNQSGRTNHQTVFVDRESEDIPGRFVDDAESVSFARNDVDHRPVEFGTAVEAADAVYCARVGDAAKVTCQRD